MSHGMLRTEAAEVLADARGDMLSVVTMQPIIPWKALGQANERNFNAQGAMGSAPAIGLGLAIARPRERVLIIDGDGSLLMQLASLVSIAEHQPANLYHAVFENGIYETSGGQDVPGRHVADLAEIARSSGYRHVVRYSSLPELRAGIAASLSLAGPVFISILISGPGAVSWPPGFQQPPGASAQIERMRLALGGPAET